MKIELAGTTVHLLPQKALLLPDTTTLVLGDLHLGKAMHFRKAGISFPQVSALRDYQVLHQLMEAHKPTNVLFLGDLFHSIHNSEWLQFEAFILDYPDTRFTLIKGNHDILKKEVYGRLPLEIVPHQLILENLIFSHEPLNDVAPGKINVAGHIHPGCMLRGLGKQYLGLPCFYCKDNVFLLPAFGHLTGLQIMAHTKGAEIFAILPDKVLKL